MYCTTSPGYPLTSSTVYSPPPRPLPRNTFSRPAFSLKKSYKHCNWKCAALSAILISVTLLFLLAYFIGESPLMLLHTGVSTSTYTPGPTPTPYLTADTVWVHAHCAPSIIRFNSVESAHCGSYGRSYKATHISTPRPQTTSKITLSFIDWVDWICRDGEDRLLLLWIGQIGNELKRHQPSHKRGFRLFILFGVIFPEQHTQVPAGRGLWAVMYELSYSISAALFACLREWYSYLMISELLLVRVIYIQDCLHWSSLVNGQKKQL